LVPLCFHTNNFKLILELFVFREAKREKTFIVT
jgi:hypothetical protein